MCLEWWFLGRKFDPAGDAYLEACRAVLSGSRVGGCCGVQLNVPWQEERTPSHTEEPQSVRSAEVRELPSSVVVFIFSFLLVFWHFF